MAASYCGTLMRKLCSSRCARLGYVNKTCGRTLSVSSRNREKKDETNDGTKSEKKDVSAPETENNHVSNEKSQKNVIIDSEFSGPSDRNPEDILEEPPADRIMRVLKYDYTKLKEKQMTRLGLEFESKLDEYHYGTNSADIVIIGGGAMGSSCAFWLKETLRDAVSILVVERDFTYKSASTGLSVGGLRQQFSLPESIQMSLYGAEFMRTAAERLKVEGLQPPQLSFEPYGYLLMASEKGTEALAENSKLQNSLGARNVLLTAKKLKERFPWLNTDGIALGCLGLEKEGWFDPWALMLGFKSKAISLGVEYVNAEVVGFQFQNMGSTTPGSDERFRRLNGVVIRRPDGSYTTISFAKCIIAAGADSGVLGRLAGFGSGPGLLRFPLPVERRKRYVFCFHCPDGPGLNTPLTVDPTGMYFRREGLLNNYISGLSPTEEEEPPTDNLEVDYNYFDEKVWPLLANRIPCFEKLKLKSAWAGFYEHNPIDMNGIIGPHPVHDNVLFACGFSGHGIQHSPAVGRAITEMIINDKYKTIDLTRLGFRRFASQEILLEKNIV